MGPGAGLRRHCSTPLGMLLDLPEVGSMVRHRPTRSLREDVSHVQRFTERTVSPRPALMPPARATRLRTRSGCTV